MNHSIFRPVAFALAAIATASLASVALDAESTAGAQAERGIPVRTPLSQQSGRLGLLTPRTSTLLLVDHQPEKILGIHSHGRQSIRNNVEALAKTARTFDVPTILTAVATEGVSAELIPEIRDIFPNAPIFGRTSINAWDDPRVVSSIERQGRPKLVMAALWTEVCLVMPAIEAIADGFDVYIVTDASAGTSTESHEVALERLMQAGAIPMTWQQVMLEWQRDWADAATSQAVADIAREHSGASGVGIADVSAMFHGDDGD